MPCLTALRLIGLLAAGAMLLGCPDAGPLPSDPASRLLGPAALMTFLPDDERYLMPGHRYPLAPQTPLEEAFQQLADQLTRAYFHRGTGPVAEIRLEVLGLYTIELPHREMRVVAVNLRDPAQAAWDRFFQGSAGGQTTFYLLAATLLQPQLSPPLADGLVVLYNGESFPELDHIRFRGIVSAEAVRPAVLRAIRQHTPASIGASG